MAHRTISLTSLCLAILLISGCKKDGVPKELEGKWVSKDFLIGTTTVQFKDGEMETQGRIFDAEYQTDKDGIILEVKDGTDIKKVRIKLLDDKTIDYGGMRFHRSNN
jgi:hypothetical protein